jgi:hypothetical protein
VAVAKLSGLLAIAPAALVLPGPGAWAGAFSPAYWAGRALLERDHPAAAAASLAVGLALGLLGVAALARVYRARAD